MRLELQAHKSFADEATPVRKSMRSSSDLFGERHEVTAIGGGPCGRSDSVSASVSHTIIENADGSETMITVYTSYYVFGVR